jgi:hypothetical protein
MSDAIRPAEAWVTASATGSIGRLYILLERSVIVKVGAASLLGQIASRCIRGFSDTLEDARGLVRAIEFQPIIGQLCHVAIHRQGNRASSSGRRHSLSMGQSTTCRSI